MLRIKPRTSAAAARWYYTGTVAQQEYLSEGGQSAGHWGGRGAVRLGLIGPVAEAAFEALCENVHPQTGDRLTVRQKHNRRVGYDLNWNPPKSVSILYGLTADPRILRAFRKALAETMEELEADAQTRVRQHGQDVNRTTGNLVWAEFIHHTARPVNGHADPHLHAHCFVFNATFDEQEGRWKAGQFGRINEDAPYYESAFHSRLAAALQEAGFRIDKRGRFFEVEGITDELIRKFSQRTAVIEDATRKHGVRSAAIKDQLGAKTREPKAPPQSTEQLRATWAQQLTPDEQTVISRLAGVRPTPALEVPHDPELAERALRYARQLSFERSSVVTERRFLEAALRYGMGRLDSDQIRAAIAADTSLIKQTLKGQSMLTSREVLAEEERLVAWVRAGHRTQPPIAPAYSLPPASDEDQKRALRHILSSRDRVTGIIGKAGAGKTTLMKEAIAAIEAQGLRVTVLAPSAEAGRGTLREAEGFKNAETVAHLLASSSTQAAAKNGVLWIDEAGMLSIPEMVQLTDLAEQLNARLILSGDPRQHRAVQRGDALRVLQDHAGLETATLTQIRRQSGIYREIVNDLAEHRLHDAFQKLDSIGRIIESPEEDRHEVLASEYLRVLEKRETALVVSPTHSEGRKVTDLVRKGLKERGDLKDERLIPVLRRIDMQAADQREPRSYRSGMVLELAKAIPCHQAGDRLIVVNSSEQGLFAQTPQGQVVPIDVRQWADRFGVYEAAYLPVGVGERLRITKNGRDQDRRRHLHNGSLHTVKGFTEEGGIVLSNGATVRRDYAHLAHGYVTTSYAAQSKTVDHVFVAESTESFPAASREQFYVSVSRGRRSPLIVTDDKQALFEAVQGTSQRLAALDMTSEIPPARPSVTAAGERDRRGQDLERASPDKCPTPIKTKVWLGVIPNVLPNTAEAISVERRREMKMEP